MHRPLAVAAIPVDQLVGENEAGRVRVGQREELPALKTMAHNTRMVTILLLVVCVAQTEVVSELVRTRRQVGGPDERPARACARGVWLSSKVVRWLRSSGCMPGVSRNSTSPFAATICTKPFRVWGVRSRNSPKEFPTGR